VTDAAEPEPGPEPEPEPDEGVLLGGRFLLGALLGVGGSAAVYQAEDLAAPPGSPRQVAVKVLHPHLGADPRAREAFLGEARAGQVLDHPGLARVHGCGVDETGGDRTTWIALELVAGGSLAERVAQRGPLPPAEVGVVLDGVLAALGAVHAAGLVHRDVSPANVLLHAHPAGPGAPLRVEDVRLVDLGLADATGRPALRSGLPARGGPGATTGAVGAVGGTGDGAAAGGAVAGAAASAAVVGTAQYMSPEQARGRPVRAAGDLYQVGALAYHLLTGRPPFPRATAAEVLAAHLSAPPPVPSALVPAARVLDAVVTRAMAKAPVRRFRDAAEMREAVAAALAAPGGPWSPHAAVTGAAVTDSAVTGPALTDPALAAAAAPGAADAPASAAAAPPALASTRAMAGAEPAGLDYLDAAPAPSTPVLRRAGSAGGGLAGVVVAAVAGLSLWGVLAATGTPGPVSTPTPAPAAVAPPVATTAPPVRAVPVPAATTPIAEPVAAPTPTAPARVAVPTLFGTLADARAALDAAGLVVGTVTRQDSAERTDRVLGQRPAAAEQVDAGTTVDVVVASGSNRVPEVAGGTVAAATATLTSAGFLVAAPDGVALDPTGTVGATVPAAGSLLAVGTEVTLTLVPSGPGTDPTVAPGSGT
jgi:eukaryotic-like serine/threonine-protein kinase